MPDASRLTVAAAAPSLASTPLASRTVALPASTGGAGLAGVAGLRLRIGGRLGLGIDDRARHFRRFLRRHQNIVLFVAVPCLRVGERFRPALPLAPAGAVRIVGLLEFAGVGQVRIRFAVRRRRGPVDRSAKGKRVERHVGVGAQGPANVLQGIGPASGARIGHGKEAAIAGAHANRVGPGVGRDCRLLPGSGLGLAILRRAVRLWRPFAAAEARASRRRRTTPRRYCWVLPGR